MQFSLLKSSYFYTAALLKINILVFKRVNMKALKEEKNKKINKFIVTWN